MRSQKGQRMATISLKPKSSSSSLAWAGLALLLIMVFNLIFTPGFFSLQIRDGHLFGSVIDILTFGAPYMVLAIGMTLVVATGGVDLSVGPVAAIAAAVVTSLIGRATDYSAMPLPMAVLIALGIAALCGLWNGVLIAYLGIQPIIATLILMVAGRGIAQLITKGQIITVYYEPFHFIGGGFLVLPFSLFIVAGVALLASLLVRRTALGLFIEAIGNNASASFYSGVAEKNIKLMVYTISGLCAGIAGVIISSNVRSADANNAGLWYELDAILSVVIGGTPLTGGRFSLLGSLLGALIIQSLTTTIYSFGVAPEVTLVVKAVVVCVVSLLQSEQFRQMVRLGRA
ncbi:ABC transporter permease [Chloroflexia bacterium SDU3-3]|nr:ABC transporter permease [Chloroflexia bacterium SDU3-3]